MIFVKDLLEIWIFLVNSYCGLRCVFAEKKNILALLKEKYILPITLSMVAQFVSLLYSISMIYRTSFYCTPLSLDGLLKVARLT